MKYDREPISNGNPMEAVGGFSRAARFVDHVDALRRRADWPALASAIRLETAEPRR